MDIAEILTNLLDKYLSIHLLYAAQMALVVKNLPANAGDVRDSDLIPGLGRSPWRRK